jgi:hypothetical protein
MVWKFGSCKLWKLYRGYTLFPQYQFGMDCRNGDFLAMDVHTWHCNSEISGEKMQKACPK